MKYRYRSPVLHGPWRASREQAVEDAIRAGQAGRADDGSIRWYDDARLEEEGGDLIVESDRRRA